MSEPQTEAIASKLRITYDRTQHCTALQEPQGKTVALDACPATGGRGEEFSPANLVGTGLVGCMLFSMGMVALQDKLDISGTEVDVKVLITDKPVVRIGKIDLTFIMPRDFSTADRVKLEEAAGACPIRSSFHPEILISTHFNYPE
jgi:putative redox protein